MSVIGKKTLKQLCRAVHCVAHQITNKIKCDGQNINTTLQLIYIETLTVIRGKKNWDMFHALLSPISELVDGLSKGF